MAAKATFALKAGVWFRRGRLLIVAPVHKQACLIRGTHATYSIVQISRAASLDPVEMRRLLAAIGPGAPTAGPAEEIASANAVTAAAIQAAQPRLAYLQAIRDVLPAEGIFCDEMTQVGYASWFGFPVSPRNRVSRRCGQLLTQARSSSYEPSAPLHAIRANGRVHVHNDRCWTTADCQCSRIIHDHLG
jgi:hypothetical protein